MTLRSFRCSATMLACAMLASCQSANPAFDAQIPPAPTVLAGDYQLIQGEWIVVYNECRGVPLPKMNGAVFVFKGDREGPERYALDQTTSPKRIDFDDERSPIMRGIYILEGARLTICANGPGESRPTEFKTSAFASTVLTHYQRR